MAVRLELRGGRNCRHAAGARREPGAVRHAAESARDDADHRRCGARAGRRRPTSASRQSISASRSAYRSNEPPGTIIIDTSRRFLYLIQPNNIALRYGVGVGRDGFQWNGLLKITRKAEWPDWTPPPEMIERQPYLPRFMAGGPGNPMGARALYLGNTIYRIHGTNAPETIGHAVSSGCFRLVNDEVMDLFERVPVGTKVIVQQ